MFVTTNMGLQVWDLGDDPYDHSELANNWAALDGHDHSTGKGKQIPEGGLRDGAVTTAKIANGAVTGPKIPNASITQDKLANNSVGSPQIIDGSVGTAELADHSVTAAKLDPSLYIIGEVIQWYRPNTSVSIPAGLEPCDGRPWSAIPNAWGVSTGFIPDMRNKFILGAALTDNGSGTTQNPDIGQSGGTHTTDLSHGHAVTGPTLSVGAHTHGIGNDGSHSHAISITTDGAHTHGITAGGTHHHGFVGTTFVVGHGRFNTGGSVFFNDTDGNPHPTSFHAVVPGGLTGDPPDDTDIDMADAGSHDHGGATGSSGSHTHTGSSGAAGTHNHGGATDAATATTSAVSGTAATQLGTLDKRPGYVGLMFLMRVL